ncbi:RNA-dependent RNA polymerase [Cronartium ribicola mitovirus 3]|uniref:RNA-dependent RNA polymerase n=1 Tax=Cronartium ribicola mitovirus 3 TaxID=1816486 RepID=A0A191KCP3_9VIRU|nr:RNA-dependent RNA polymerase [Cronartium ribicola mitovirus 3]AMQ67416.1 RNA-dependent RNA polymerase [Cronartium ribicola mitovirus 3]
MNMNQNKAYSALVQAIFTFLIYYSPGFESDKIVIILSDFKRHCDQRGIKAGISWIKDLRLCFTKYQAGDSKPKVNIKCHPNGCPRLIWDNYKDVLNDPKGIGIIITLLSISRPFEGIFEPSLSDITDTPKTDLGIIKDLEEFLPAFFEEVVHVRKESGQLKRPKWSSWLNNIKIAPNGVSINSSYADLDLHNEEIIRDLFELGGDCFEKEYSSIKDYWKDPEGQKEITKNYPIVNTYKSKYLGRLAVIPSPEGKSRVIAIGDYWSQNVLFPLHNKIFGLLKRIPQDLTFAQEQGLSKIKKDRDHSYWSLDLKSATDRFPIELQRRIISYIYGESYSISWRNLMSRPFYQTISGKSEVTYGAGQPIGIYSSWSVFTLCHHFVLYCAQRRSIALKKGRYVILGDDIVISDDNLAIEYKKLINLLGVEISEHKTHKSKHSYEIAKRWITEKGEQSPFPIIPLIQSKSWVPAIVNTIIDAEEKGWVPSCSTFKIAAIIAMLKRKSSNQGLWNHIYKLSMIHSSCYLAFKDKISNMDCINMLTDAFQIERLSQNEVSASILIAQASKNILATLGKEIFKSTLFQLPEEIQKVKELVDFEETTWSKYSPQEHEMTERLPHCDVLRKICGKIFEPDFPGIQDEPDPKSWKRTIRGLISFDVKKVFIKDKKRVEILQVSKVSKSLCGIIKSLNNMEEKELEWTNLKPGSSSLTSLNYLFFP